MTADQDCWAAILDPLGMPLVTTKSFPATPPTIPCTSLPSKPYNKPWKATWANFTSATARMAAVATRAYVAA